MELFKPEFGLVFWMFLAFACLYFILAKYAWPFIIKSMEERADLIDKGVAYAQEAKSHLDNAKAEADQVIAEARKQQADILRDAAKMKSQLIEEAKAARQPEATGDIRSNMIVIAALVEGVAFFALIVCILALFL